MDEVSSPEHQTPAALKFPVSSLENTVTIIFSCQLETVATGSVVNFFFYQTLGR